MTDAHIDFIICVTIVTEKDLGSKVVDVTTLGPNELGDHVIFHGSLEDVLGIETDKEICQFIFYDLDSKYEFY